MPASLSDRLTGRRALITGASAGLGQALARSLAEHGVSLVLVARRRDRLDAFARDLAGQTGVEVQVEHLDLCDAGAAQTIWDRTEAVGREIDILVNNAGVAVYDEFIASDWRSHEHILQLHVCVVTQLTRMFVEGMVRRGRGYLVNVASLAAETPCPSLAVYAASKTYVRHFTDALAFELRGTGVTAMSVCPGPMETEFFERAGIVLTPVGRLFCTPAPDIARRTVRAMVRGRTSVAADLAHRALTAPLGLIPRRWRTQVVDTAFRIGLRKVAAGGDVHAAPHVGSLVAWLDRLIDRSHHVTLFGRPYHPFLLMADVALGLALLLAVIVMSVEHLPPVRFGMVVAAVVLGYPYYLRLKLLVAGTRARSFLPDLLLFGLPTMGVVSWAVGIPLRPIADLVGLALPLLLSFGRIGCFLGGCCYGVPCATGVRYGPIVWAPRHGGRPYAPDPDPCGRVFPIQLVDAAFNLLVFVALAARATVGGLDGRALPLYLLLYSVFRFFVDFFRGEPTREQWGRLSEAQWLGILIGTVSIVALAMRS
jgi:short-subunit dehydrogenase